MGFCYKQRWAVVMLKKNKILLMLFISVFVLTGCEYQLDAIEPLNEDEVISYAKEKIFDETGDDILVKIISKEQIKFHDALFWWSYRVKGGYTYKLEIVNNINPNICATATYTDGYKRGDNIIQSIFESNYKEQQTIFLSKLLNNEFDKNYVYLNQAQRIYDIFIVSSDYNKISNLITQLDNVISKINYYRIYIYKDENAFDSAKFKLYHGIDGFPDIEFVIQDITGKWPTRIYKSDAFNYELFMSSQSNDYNYLIYTYDTFDNDEVIYNKFEIFGIK